MPLARKIFKTHFNNQATAMEETMRNRKKKTKMGGEGVIDPRAMTNVSNMFFMSLCSANYLNLRTQ